MKIKPATIYAWMNNAFACNYPLRFLELGAHHGEDTAAILRMFPLAKCELWECDPRCIRGIHENIQLRAVAWPVKLHENAVGDSAGEETFHQSGGLIRAGREWDFSGSLLRPTKHLTKAPDITFANSVTVRVETLDRIYPPPNIFDFVWMDIQGGEAGAIRGGKRLLSFCGFVYMEAEVEPLYDGQATAPELTATMRELGFAVVGKFENNLLFENKAIEDLLE